MSFKQYFEEKKSVHDPVRPGILKRQVKGKMTCSKAKSLKSKQKNKGNNTAKAAQRYLNYHCNEQQIQQPQQNQSKLDQLQAALDVAGFEPTIGTGADATNTVISGLRAALAKEPDERKKHLLNAGISAISLIPFADVIKLVNIRKLGKPATRLVTQGARNARTWGKQQQTTDRFNTNTAVA
jgi:hypothetical protein